MIHELKILPQYFADVISGNKTFEIRKFDRPFHKGDLLALNEYDAEKQCYTGNCCVVWVDYILDEQEYCKQGYVVMSIKACTVWKHQKPLNEMKYSFEYSVPLITRESEVDTE